MNIDELPTPAVIIDLDAAERNIRKMQDYVNSKGCGVRPHAKAHKSPFMAKKQVDAGAVGQCCQTLIEAEALMLNGIDHVLLTANLATKGTIERFLNLGRNGDIKIIVDGKENAEMLAAAARHRGATVDVLVDVDVGANKTGQQPGEPAAKFARWITETDGLRFRGLQCYEGHLQISTPDFEERKSKAMVSLGMITSTIRALGELGIDPEIVTCAGTATYNICAGYPGVTDIQPGSYLYMDRRYGEIATAGTDFEKAMTVLATVTSAPTPTRAVTDLGWKGVGIEYEGLGYGGMPVPLLPGLRYTPGGDEHGILTAQEARYRPSVGDRVRFVPAHCDTTLNLYGTFYGVRGDRIEVAGPVARR
jgi:D-serine deaminase-like pyridoxal phosphate-dependent protein